MERKIVSTLVSFTKSANDEATEGAMYAMPATPLQVRLWKLNQAPDPAWNVAVRFRLSGELDRDKFDRALQLLATRHEALRTSLMEQNGEVIERIVSHKALPLQWCDLRSLDWGVQQEEIERLSLEHARQILSLISAPLLRTGMLQLSDTEHILVWNAHHSICDGWSVGLLVRDLMDCYGAALRDEAPAARTSLDYGDYAVWLDAQRKTPEYEAHRQYWKHHLQGLDIPRLPDAWRTEEATTEGSAIQSILLPRSLTDAIAMVAQRHRSTFFHAVLAAFGLLLRVQQSISDIALETPMSGRDQSELENVVGTFVNYLPLRFRVDAEMSFSRLLHEVCDMVTDCFDHAQFRYEDMLAEQEGEGTDGRTLPIPVALICQQDFVRPVTAAGLSMTAMPSVSPGALRPLTVFMVERADGWRLSCEVDNRVVSREAGFRLLEDFQRLLGAIAAAAEESTGEIAARAGLPAMRTPAEENIAGRVDGAEKTPDGVVRLPGTEFQRRFWRLDTLNPGGVAFHVRVRLQLRGRLDVDALARAVATVARRNEILRTTLEEENDQVWQAIHPELPIDFCAFVSAVQGPDGVRSYEQRLADHAIIDREGQIGFSLTSGPLFRVRVLRLEENRHWLAITLSHGIVDGWSTGLFLEQLQQAYEQEIGFGNASKNSAPVQFSAHAETERNLLRSSEKARRLAWWQTYLSGVWTPMELPRDLQGLRADAGDARAGLVTETLDAATVASARRFARECQTTLFAVFGGLFQALLWRYSGQSSILFLTPHANRTENTETAMGPLADPICLTAHIGSETTFRQLVTRLGEESMDAMERALPLNLVTPLVDMRVGSHYHPLNQITFFYQRAFVHEMEWKGLEIDSLPDVPAVTGSEWQLGVVERENGVFLEFLYDATLYSEKTIQFVQRHFAHLLREAVMAPDRPLAQLKPMTAEEMEKYSTAAQLLPVIERLLPRREAIAPAVAATAERDKTAGATTEPVSQSQRDMIRVWRQVLKIEELDLDSNFFDIGGHSLLLARLQTVLKREFNVQLTAAEVFRHPTVRTLAAWLDQAQTETKNRSAIADGNAGADRNLRIIPIQPLGAGHPIFVISQSMIFRTLATELGTEQPVYAIQTLEQDNAVMATANYEQLIDFYVRLVREVQPSGPYRLAGWCVSGWIAYGVARRLEEMGQEIELAMIIDAWAPTYWNSQPRLRKQLMLAIYHLQRFRWTGSRPRKIGEGGPDSLWRQSLQALAVAVGKLGVRLQRWAAPAESGETDDDRINRHLQATARLAGKSGPLQGKALLFRSEEEPKGPMLADDMGWSDLFGRSVEVEVMPGDHHEIFNLPGARMMALRARAMLGLDTPSWANEAAAPDLAELVENAQCSTGPEVVR